MTPEFVKRFVTLEKDIAKEKGRFTLFMLLLREEIATVTSTSDVGQVLVGRWDLVASASWIYDDKKGSFEYFATKVRHALPEDQLLSVSRIALLREDNPFVVAVTRAFHVDGETVEVADTNLFGIQVHRAFIITSRKERTTARKKAASHK